MKRSVLIITFIAAQLAATTTIQAMLLQANNDSNGVSGYSSGKSMVLVVFVIALVAGAIVLALRKKK
jgi:hypothetical protein